MEMDAASNTGIDDVRQITDGVRYSPVTARMKVYIIDEVHMLSEKAFNAFLKTLEEPPPHAKFIFATTEIRKVPVTILSRCQRFDLRRVEAQVLVNHLAGICAKEGVEAHPDALTLIARVSEGSVRDALSLLDQSISHGGGHVELEATQTMLGVADPGRVIDLFEAAMRGDLPAALSAMRNQYDGGADPATIIAELANFTHLVTRLKITPSAASDGALSEIERRRGQDFAAALPIRVLSRAWQMLSKGVGEVQQAHRPLAAAEMVMVRLAYAADLPTPDEALRMLREAQGNGGSGAGLPRGNGGGAAMSGGGSYMARPSGGALRDEAVDAAPRIQAAQREPVAHLREVPRSAEPAPQPRPAPPAPQGLAIARFEDLVALAGEKREVGIRTALHRDVRLVRFEDGHLEFALVPGASRSLAGDLSRLLQEWTGRRWIVAVSNEPGAPTLHEQDKAREEARREDATNHPLVQSVLGRFPGARIVDIRSRAAPEPASPSSPGAPSGDDALDGTLADPDMPADIDEDALGEYFDET
jgi:DNA polymerase-3 subunit gamma/tau